MLAALAVFLWPAPLVAATNPARQAPAMVPSQELVRRATAGEPIDLTGVTLAGDLDLTAVGTITRPLRCHQCRLAGALEAPDVVFERLVDFSDSKLEGPVDLRGSVFRDHARFDDTDFLGEAAFASARFAEDASFTRGSFGAGAEFVAVTFAGHADFAQRCFADCEGPRLCDGARGRDGAANFEGAVFAGDASFLLARFADRALFRGVELRQGASFLGACLNEGADLGLLTSGGPIDFDGALASADIDLSNMASSGAVSLVGIRPFRTAVEGEVRRFQLTMEQLSVDELSMDVEVVGHVVGRDVQEEILELIERSAQQREDLSVANDARYRRLSLQGQDEAAWRLADRILYRVVAGYLVRPAHPLVTLLVVLTAATLIRSAPRLRALARGAKGWRVRRHPLRQMVLGAEKAITVVCESLARSLGVAFRPKPDEGTGIADRERIASYFLAAARWSEFLVYKVLLAVLLLTLANSYVTVREIIDAV